MSKMQTTNKKTCSKNLKTICKAVKMGNKLQKVFLRLNFNRSRAHEENLLVNERLAELNRKCCTVCFVHTITVRLTQFNTHKHTHTHT